ncbi:hypothetical protein [Brucella pseudogrignonensis]|uniref:Uncharacterized protein n=1 Tax=Brucella pseudogrignonensis TaxID=419475 RepID=A0ABU1M686_9HYPH|nr:hypothetical protein [Brucella pseudogrignonensis]MDR6431256.1 hypothetical protein [Brucella pseudogrignonensis]
MVAETNERAVIGGNNPPIKEALADQYKELVSLIDPIAERANAHPRKIESDDDLGPLGEIVLDAKALSKRIEAARKTEKDPFVKGGKEVDQFFHPLTDRLDRIVDVFENEATKYQRAKAEAERRRAADEAAKLRAEEDRKLREAETAKRDSTVERKKDEAADLNSQAADADRRADASAAELTKVRTDNGVTASAKTKWAFRIVDLAAIDLNSLRDFFRVEDIEKAIRSKVAIHKGNAKIEGVDVFEDVKATFR